MTEPTFNPYNFVPIPIEPPGRAGYPGLDRLVGYSGRLTCDLVALTRLFTAAPRRDPPAMTGGRNLLSFLRYGESEAMVQGTTLKGMVRTVFEAAYPSCLALTQDVRRTKVRNGRTEPGYAYTIPPAFAPGACTTVEALCPSCRLFGMIYKDSAHAQGRVAFGDALMDASKLVQERVQLAELSAPKPRHALIYGRNGKQRDEIAGRKFYYHHDQPRQAFEARGSSTMVEHAPPGSRFRFTVLLQNLDEEEIRRLVGCLVLDEAHGHKIGMARPLGFGSCRIELLDGSRVKSAAERYQGWEPSGSPGALPPAYWQPAKGWLRGELADLLRLEGKPGREVGYLTYGSYGGQAIDGEGRFVADAERKSVDRALGNAEPSGEAAGAEAMPSDTPNTPVELVHGGEMDRLKSLAALAPDSPGPEPRHSKRGDRITIEVVGVEGQVYKLREVGGSLEITYKGWVHWSLGQRREVRVTKRRADGSVKEVAP